MRISRRHSMAQRAEFSRVKKRGHSKGGRFLVLATLEDESLPEHRWAFVTSRRVGNAVTRNKIRRRLRSIVSKRGERLRDRRYLVMIARYRAAEASFEELENEWLRLAKRLDILEGTE